MTTDESTLHADDKSILEELRIAGLDFEPMRGLGNWPAYVITRFDDGECHITTVHIGPTGTGLHADLVLQFPRLSMLLIERPNGDTATLSAKELTAKRVKALLKRRVSKPCTPSGYDHESRQRSIATFTTRSAA